MSLFDGYGPDNPLVMAGAGTCKTLDLDAIEPLANAADLVVAGSMTLEERAGNAGVLDYFGDLYSVNSYGMPNQGSDSGWEQKSAYPDDRFAELRRRVIVSLAEFSALGYYQLFKKLCEWGLASE